MKVLIVDDEELVRRALRRACASRSHEVVEATDGIAGVEAWKSEQPDLVFLDVLMPGLTGPQVLAKMGAENKAKVVLISAFTGEYDVEKAKSVGADLFIPKPFEDIFEVVASAEALLSE